MSRVLSSSQQGQQQARMTMHELETLAVSLSKAREKKKHSSSSEDPNLSSQRTKEELRPQDYADIEAFLEELKTPPKVVSSFGGSVGDQEATINKRFKEFEEKLRHGEFSSTEEVLKELLAPSPRKEMYAVQLALDSAKWKRSGLSYSNFVKEEAVKFLNDTLGSSSRDWLVNVYEDAENAFFCSLYEDELKAIKGKKEVVQVKLVDELMFLRLSGFSSNYTMYKTGGFGMQHSKYTVFDL